MRRALPGVSLLVALTACVVEPANDDDATDDATTDDDDTNGPQAPCDEVHPDRTVGLLRCDPRAEGGYTLFAPLATTNTWLIDPLGQVVQSWPGARRPGSSVSMLPNGNLLRTASRDMLPTYMPAPAGNGGIVEEIDWDGAVVWSFHYSSASYDQHHDVESLPNGNVLLLAWERRSAEEAVAAGRDPASMSSTEVWPEHLVEVNRAGVIVWTWRLWDHLVQDRDPTSANYDIISEAPGRLDVNHLGTGGFDASGVDWNHANSVSYDAENDQIAISAFAQGEVWIIDHSTTPQEAASGSGGRSGRGGDFLMRWGNSAAWGQGDEALAPLGGQHDAQIIAAGLPGAGNLLVFDNLASEGSSGVYEVELPRLADGNYSRPAGGPFGPQAPLWAWAGTTEEPMFSAFVGGAQRLPGGNTLICEGQAGRILEVTPDGDVVWEYVNPELAGGPLRQGELPPETGPFSIHNSLFRATRVPADHPGLAGRDLSPKGTIELP